MIVLSIQFDDDGKATDSLIVKRYGSEYVNSPM